MSTERRDMIRGLLGATWLAVIVIAIILVLVYAVPVLSAYFSKDRLFRDCVQANHTTPDKWAEMVLTCRKASEESSQ